MFGNTLQEVMELQEKK